jgi:hypothetical protein
MPLYKVGDKDYGKMGDRVRNARLAREGSSRAVQAFRARRWALLNRGFTSPALQ